MQFINDIFSNSAFITALIAMMVAQVFKLFWSGIVKNKWDLSLLWSASSMPSSHSSVVMSLTTSVGYIEGVSSSLFALTAFIAILFMYDAQGVRKASGEQAVALNYLLDIEKDIEPEHLRYRGLLQERLGHTTSEVIGGAIVGFVVTIAIHLFF